MMRKYENGEYKDMSAEEVAAIQQQVVITNEQVPPCKLIHAFVTDTSVEKY